MRSVPGLIKHLDEIKGLVARIRPVYAAFNLSAPADQDNRIGAVALAQNFNINFVRKFERLAVLVGAFNLNHEERMMVNQIVAANQYAPAALEAIIRHFSDQSRYDQMISSLSEQVLPARQRELLQKMQSLRDRAGLLLSDQDRWEIFSPERRSAVVADKLVAAGIPREVASKRSRAKIETYQKAMQAIETRGYRFMLEQGVGELWLFEGEEYALKVCDRLDRVRALDEYLGFDQQACQARLIDVVRANSLSEKLAVRAERFRTLLEKSGADRDLRRKIQRQLARDPRFDKAAERLVGELKAQGRVSVLIDALDGPTAVAARLFSGNIWNCARVLMADESELPALLSETRKELALPAPIHARVFSQDDEHAAVFSQLSEIFEYFGFRGRELTGMLQHMVARRSCNKDFASSLNKMVEVCRIVGLSADDPQARQIYSMFEGRLKNNLPFGSDVLMKELVECLKLHPGWIKVFTAFRALKNQCLKANADMDWKVAATLLKDEETLMARAKELQAISGIGRDRRKVRPLYERAALFAVLPISDPETIRARFSDLLAQGVTQEMFDRFPFLLTEVRSEQGWQTMVGLAFMRTGIDLAGADNLTLAELQRARFHLNHAVQLLGETKRPDMDRRAAQKALAILDSYEANIIKYRQPGANLAEIKTNLRAAYEMCLHYSHGILLGESEMLVPLAGLLKRAMAEVSIEQMAQIAGNEEALKDAFSVLQPRYGEWAASRLGRAAEVQRALGTALNFRVNQLLLMVLEQVIPTLKDADDTVYFVLKFLDPELEVCYGEKEIARLDLAGKMLLSQVSADAGTDYSHLLGKKGRREEFTLAIKLILFAAAKRRHHNVALAHRLSFIAQDIARVEIDKLADAALEGQIELLKQYLLPGETMPRDISTLQHGGAPTKTGVSAKLFALVEPRLMARREQLKNSPQIIESWEAPLATIMRTFWSKQFEKVEPLLPTIENRPLKAWLKRLAKGVRALEADEIGKALELFQPNGERAVIDALPWEQQAEFSRLRYIYGGLVAAGAAWRATYTDPAEQRRMYELAVKVYRSLLEIYPFATHLRVNIQNNMGAINLELPAQKVPYWKFVEGTFKLVFVG